MCLSLHIEVLSFEDSEWTTDARKWSAKWRNWNISDILLFEFNRVTKATVAAGNIYAMYGDNAIGESKRRKWFSCFKEDYFDISDTPRSGTPSEFDEDVLNTLIHNDPRQCTRELSDVMNCDHSSIVRHLHSLVKGSEIRCICTICSKPKPQKSAGSYMCISVCSSSFDS